MQRSLERRLARLETRSGTQAQVLAIRFAASTEVEVCGTKERMTLEAFRARYPHGIIVKVVYKELWEAL